MEIGRGASARVYRGIQVSDQKPVALKLFHATYWDDPVQRIRAIKEFEILSQLNHPNIVGVINAHLEDAHQPSVTMELVDGPSLQKFQGRLPYVLPEISLLIVKEVLEGLKYAHASKVIHRDLKPSNILIGHDGKVAITDFGLAKSLDSSVATVTGTIMGSPDYMSPEQAQGLNSDARSDLFSLSAILYFLVTGTRPFARHSAVATLAAVIEGKAEKSHRRNPKVSSELSSIIHKGLHPNPELRFQSADQMLETIDEYLDGLSLDPTWFNFRSWLSSPDEVTYRALTVLASQLVHLCENDLKTYRSEMFAEHLSHLSQVAPESTEIARLMSLFNRKKRKKVFYWKLFSAVSLCLLLGLIGAGFWIFLPLEQSLPFLSASSPLVLDPAPDSLPTPAPAPRNLHSSPEPARSTKKPNRKTPAQAPQKIAQQTVRFQVSPDVRVYWDNQQVDPKKELLETLGKHTLRLEKEGWNSKTVEILVTQKEPVTIKAE